MIQPLASARPLTKICQIKSMKEVDSPKSNKEDYNPQPLLRKHTMPVFSYSSTAKDDLSTNSRHFWSHNQQNDPSPESKSEDTPSFSQLDSHNLEVSIDDLFSKIEKIKSQFSSGSSVESPYWGSQPTARASEIKLDEIKTNVYDSMIVGPSPVVTPSKKSNSILQSISIINNSPQTSPFLSFGFHKSNSLNQNYHNEPKSATPFNNQGNPKQGLIFTKSPSSHGFAHKGSLKASSTVNHHHEVIVRGGIPQSTRNSIGASPALPRQLKITDFQLGKLVGSGKFGDVFQCRHKATGTLYALKKVFKSTILEYKMVEQFTNQLKIHYSLKHPNIVELYTHFEDQYHIFLLMQYLDGGMLMNYAKSEEKFVSRVMLQVVKAVEYLHHKNVAHRDIKPQNILFSHGVVKLCDFGWAANCDTGMRKTFCGTLDYVSPEILEEREYSVKVDLWSLGVLAFEMLAGFPPFQQQIAKLKVKKIKDVDKNNVLYPPQITKEGQDFISRFLKKDPLLRMSLRECLSHPFLYKHNAKEEMMREIKAFLTQSQ